MEVITIQSEAFRELMQKIDSISAHVALTEKASPLSETWLDIQEACVLLKVSKRTLQSYRDKGTLSFSKIGGKIYFRAAEIEEHLASHMKNANSSAKKN